MTVSKVPFFARFALLCTALLCAIPFLQPYHRNPLTAFYSEWFAIALGLGVATVLLSRRAWAPAEMPWVALSPLALALLLVAHGLLGWSPYLGSALSAALVLIWAALLVVAVRALVRLSSLHAVLQIVAAGIAVGALLSALVGCLQHAQLATLVDSLVARTTGAAIFGNLAQANHFASYTALGLLALAYLHLRSRIGLVVLVLSSAPMLFVLGLSGSRTAALYLLTSFALAAWFRWRTNDEAMRRLFLVCACYFFGYCLMQIGVGAGLFRVDARYSVTAVERIATGGASLSDRISLWQSAWAIFLGQPLTGSGWGTFALHTFERAGDVFPAGGYQLYHNAHNLVFHLLAETGLAGIACAGLPLLAAIRFGSLQSDTRPELWLIVAAAAVLLLHSLLEYPLWYAYFLGLAALLLGVAPLRVHALRLSRYWQWIVLAMLCIGAVNLSALWLDYRRFESLFRSQHHALYPHQIAEVMMRTHQNLLLRPYAEVAMALPMTLDEAGLERQLYMNGRALRFVPDATLVYRQVLLLALADRLPEAQQLLLQARHAYPAPPPAFERDLARLAQAQPARFRPLLESAPRRAAAHP
jgi:O-antigen ligase